MDASITVHFCPLSPFSLWKMTVVVAPPSSLVPFELPEDLSWGNIVSSAAQAGFDGSLGGLYRFAKAVHQDGRVYNYIPSDVQAAFGNMFHDATGLGSRRNTTRMLESGMYFDDTGSMRNLTTGGRIESYYDADTGRDRWRAIGGSATPAIEFHSTPAAPLVDPGVSTRTFYRGGAPFYGERMYSRRVGVRRFKGRGYTYGKPRIPRHRGPVMRRAPVFRSRFYRIKWRRSRRPGRPVRRRFYLRRPGF